MKLYDALRYVLWGGVAATAFANHREYRMTTTWLPHLLTNTLSLLLPDVARVVLRMMGKPAHRDVRAVAEVAERAVAENPQYAVYVAPLALGYILSHPHFNIYKGRMAELRLGGFGLDALPHSATAFALTALVASTAEHAGQTSATRSVFAPLVCWSREHPALASFLVLAGLSALWETSEYLVHQHEMRLRGDASLINMQWSGRDTLNDLTANLLGWALATALRRGGTE